MRLLVALGGGKVSPLLSRRSSHDRKIMANYESYRDSLLNLIQSGRIMGEDQA